MVDLDPPVKCWRCRGHLKPHQSLDDVWICDKRNCGALYTEGVVKELKAKDAKR